MTGERDWEMAYAIFQSDKPYGFVWNSRLCTKIAEALVAAREEGRRKEQERINTPQTADFLGAVGSEAAHQIERWGPAHDRGKSAENWYWLVGYLAGKALRATIQGDREKALHHTISSAAALLHWHTAISADRSGNGRGDDRDLEEIARYEKGDQREPRPITDTMVDAAEQTLYGNDDSLSETAIAQLRAALEAAEKARR